jgi:hypothetical protein
VTCLIPTEAVFVSSEKGPTLNRSQPRVGKVPSEGMTRLWLYCCRPQSLGAETMELAAGADTSDVPQEAKELPAVRPIS